MGKMKDLFIAREEWAEKTARELDEKVELLDTDYPEWWQIKLHDGIVLTRIDDTDFVEHPEVSEDFFEVDPNHPEERGDEIKRLRELLKNKESEN